MTQEQIDRIEKKVDAITNALVGTEFTGHKGLTDAVQQNTHYRRNSAKRTGLIAGISTGVGFIFGLITNWFKTHFL